MGLAVSSLWGAKWLGYGLRVLLLCVEEIRETL